MRLCTVLLATLIAPALWAGPDLSGLRINEIQSVGGFRDYVEIYSAGDTPVELATLVLRDRLYSGDGNEFTFCLGRIWPGERWVAYCPYFLNSHGEEVGLYDEEGTLLDSVSFPPFPEDNDDDISYGRLPDGGDIWCFQEDSEGAPNRLGSVPPVVVVDVRYAPVNPQIGESIQVTASVVSAGATGPVEVVYGPPDGPWTSSIPAYDDGLHGDGEPGDMKYGAVIPPFGGELFVEYGVRATGQNVTELYRGHYLHYAYEAPTVRINEVLAMNRKTGTWLPGSVGPFADYIELYNFGSSRVNVSQLMFRERYRGDYGYALMTDLGGPLWLDPGQHLLVWASREVFGLAPIGVDLSLSHNGEDLLLIAPDRVSVIDAVRYPPLGADTAYGRDPEGTGSFRVLETPSPEGGDVYPHGVTAFIGCALAAPGPGDELPLRVWVAPDVNSPTVEVDYRLADTSGVTPLYNDGMSGDDQPDDEIFGGVIPPIGRSGELQLAVIVVDAGGQSHRDPAQADEWYSIPVGQTPIGRLVINEIRATRFDEGGICPEEWSSGDPKPSQQSKFVEIFNNGISLEDIHFVITGSMFNWSRGVEFKRGHIANLGSVKAFPWENLDTRGGTLFLRGVETGTLYDAVTYPVTAPGQSYGRSPDGGPWRVLDTPSPDELNGPFPFVRGDSNGDQNADISDAIGILLVLFSGAKTDCEDALDGDDSGLLNITDGIYVLSYLFVGGPPPPAPFPNQGEDDTGDDLGCRRTLRGVEQ